MMVIGFLMALLVVRLLTRRAGLDLTVMSSAAVFSLIIGLIGARTFFVLHHLGKFSGNLLSIFAIWRGGLEFLGGNPGSCLPAVLPASSQAARPPIPRYHGHRPDDGLGIRANRMFSERVLLRQANHAGLGDLFSVRLACPH